MENEDWRKKKQKTKRKKIKRKNKTKNREVYYYKDPGNRILTTIFSL